MIRVFRIYETASMSRMYSSSIFRRYSITVLRVELQPPIAVVSRLFFMIALLSGKPNLGNIISNRSCSSQKSLYFRLRLHFDW